jgi:23S rRNA U2552 (ribose-2'-O)-methylase RlmE/FtsJ
MAPNTIWFRDIDAMRSIELLRTTLPIYEQFLKTWGKAVIKIFMWPGFEEFIADFKKTVWSSNVKTFKPKAVRKESKEIYIVKF